MFKKIKGAYKKELDALKYPTTPETIASNGSKFNTVL